MNVPWENAHGGALYCLIRGDEFSAWHRLLFQRPGCAESVLACRHFLDGSPVARCSYPEEYHPCVISRIALLCDSVGWTADVERISAWLNGLDRETYELVFAAIEVLEEEGPALGCPLVDTVRGSRHKNMKELRPGSQGRSEVRILFAFDPARQAIMLAAGNKAGRWTQWYDEKIKAADEMFAEHLAQFEDTKLARLSHSPRSRWLRWRTSGRAGYPASRTATSAPHRSTHCANTCPLLAENWISPSAWEMRHSPWHRGTNRSRRSWPDTNHRRPSVGRDDRETCRWRRG